MLLENQYNQFKEDLNIPKPKGGMAFITDFEKKDHLLSITHGKADNKDQAGPAPAVALGAPSAAVALAPAPPAGASL